MKKSFFLLLLSLSLICIHYNHANGQQITNGKNIRDSIELQTESIFDKLVEIRRKIHEYPELAGKEEQTQKIIKQYLLDLGFEVDTNIYGYSVVGILNSDKKGRKIAWRAEMDALPDNLTDSVDFKSKIKNVRHGCGHDVHIAIALGIAEILAKNKTSINGTVYFIFQPAEETFVGAKAMVDNGLFTKIKPDEIYGLHVTPMPVGKIIVKPDEMYAHQRRIRIALKDQLSDGEIKVLTTKIHDTLLRVLPGSKPWETKYLIDPQIGAGNPNTIYKDYLFMAENSITHSKNGELFLDASFYETNLANLKAILPRVERVVKQNGYENKLLSVTCIQENPTVINNKALTVMVVNTIKRIFGNESIDTDYGLVPYSNDDFAYFQQKVPGVYFFIGGSNFEKGLIALNHAPNFRVDENCIKTSVERFSTLLFERLRN